MPKPDSSSRVTQLISDEHSATVDVDCYGERYVVRSVAVEGTPAKSNADESFGSHEEAVASGLAMARAMMRSQT